MTIIRAASAAALVLAIASPALAEPADDAIAAYSSGDYATAAQLARPLAAQGDRAAQGLLGVLYAEGRGVPRDALAAYVWLDFGVSALSGEIGQAARGHHVIIAAKMTAPQAAQAKAMSAQCLASNFKTCGPPAR